MSKFFGKYREPVLYIFFGFLTTGINYLVYGGGYFLFSKAMQDENAALVANTFAWVAAVAFAYVTVKLFVFQQKSWAPAVLRRELPGFVGTRVFSFAIEQGLLFLFLKVLKNGALARAAQSEWLLQWPAERLSTWYDLCAKVPIMIIVLVLNYAFSKWIFKKGKKE